jgi:hypothetical protein
MTNSKVVSEKHSNKIIKAAIFSGVLNALINGIINWFQVKDKTELFLTVDSISTGGHTVLGGAVILATSLAIILTSIGYFTFKSPNKPAYFPRVFLLTLKNAFFHIWDNCNIIYSTPKNLQDRYRSLPLLQH